jgi:hypothetical protein
LSLAARFRHIRLNSLSPVKARRAAAFEGCGRRLRVLTMSSEQQDRTGVQVMAHWIFNLREISSSFRWILTIPCHLHDPAVKTLAISPLCSKGAITPSRSRLRGGRAWLSMCRDFDCRSATSGVCMAPRIHVDGKSGDGTVV